MTLQQLLRRGLLVLLVLGLAACKKYTIEEPVADSLHADTAVSFRVAYKQQPAKLPVMQLNGFNVQSFFTADATSASAGGADIQAYLKEGYNVFQVEPPLGPQVKFLYDSEGPGIVVLDAVEDNGEMTISGRGIDEMGVASGTVNGTTITFDEDGAFTVTVPKQDTYTYNTVDTLGHTNTVHYADLKLQYDPSLTLRITQHGLDFAMGQVVNALNGADLNSLVAGTTLYDSTSKGLFGETYGADGFVRSISLAANAFGMDLQNGNQAGINGDISNVHIELTLRLHNGFLPPTVINLGANAGPLDFDGILHLSVEDHAMQASISDFNYQIGNIVIDEVDVPVLREIISGVAAGIANLLEGTISNALQDTLNQAIPGLLNSLVMESHVIRIQDHAGSNFDMAMSLNIEQLETTSDTLFVSTSGSLIPVNPNLNIPQPLAGSLFTFDQLPPAQLSNNDFALSLNSNVINQALASAHSVGLTHMSMIGGGESDYNIQLGLPRDEDFGPADATHRILVNMGAPANVKFRDVNGNAEPTLSVYQIEVFGQSRKKGSSVYTDDIAVRVSAEVALVLGLGDNNQLTASFRQAPSVKLEGVKIGSGAWSGPVVNATANNLIATAIAAVMSELTKPIENIKLPTFACMTFEDVNINAVGEEGGHLNISGSLTQASEDCINGITPPPQVGYGRGAGVPLSCASGQEYDAGLCYTPCNEGYNGVGPVCWKEEASYERGAGTVPNQCAPGQVNDAGLCYNPCSPGYQGVGPVCYSDLPASYGRGAGTIPTNIFTGACPAGKENQAGLCYTLCNPGYHGEGPVCWLDNPSYGRGVGVAPNQCAPGYENDAGLCYQECQAGFHGVGPVCWTNDALSYERGVGTAANTCHDGWDKDGALCYEQCSEGFNGIGPVCWPEGMEAPASMSPLLQP